MSRSNTEALTLELKLDTTITGLLRPSLIYCTSCTRHLSEQSRFVISPKDPAVGIVRDSAGPGSGNRPGWSPAGGILGSQNRLRITILSPGNGDPTARENRTEIPDLESSRSKDAPAFPHLTHSRQRMSTLGYGTEHHRPDIDRSGSDSVNDGCQLVCVKSGRSGSTSVSDNFRTDVIGKLAQFVGTNWRDPNTSQMSFCKVSVIMSRLDNSRVISFKRMPAIFEKWPESCRKQGLEIERNYDHEGSLSGTPIKLISTAGQFPSYGNRSWRGIE